MEISCPWFFDSENYHIKVCLRNEIIVKNICGDSENIFTNLPTNELLFTFSSVKSTVNKNHKYKINYNEFIIKSKVYYNNREYYYPIVTFVNDEYSLIRGYMLGFEKKLADIDIGDSIIRVSSKYIKMQTHITNCNKCNKDFKTYPFILYRNFNFGKDICKNDIVLLDIYNYIIKSYNDIYIDINDFSNLFSLVGIKQNNIKNIDSIVLRDVFELKGVVEIGK